LETCSPRGVHGGLAGYEGVEGGHLFYSIFMDSITLSREYYYYRLVWAEAKSDATSVIFYFTANFRIILQRNLQTDPIQKL